MGPNKESDGNKRAREKEEGETNKEEVVVQCEIRYPGDWAAGGRYV